MLLVIIFAISIGAMVAVAVWLAIFHIRDRMQQSITKVNAWERVIYDRGYDDGYRAAIDKLSRKLEQPLTQPPV